MPFPIGGPASGAIRNCRAMSTPCIYCANRAQAKDVPCQAPTRPLPVCRLGEPGQSRRHWPGLSERCAWYSAAYRAPLVNHF